MKSWLEQNAIEMYSTHNEGKSVIAERFVRLIHGNRTECQKNILKT